MQIFLVLAVACFVVVTVLKYANPDARAEVGNTLAGNTANGHETRSAEGGHVGNGEAGLTEQRETLSRRVILWLTASTPANNSAACLVDNTWPQSI